MGSSRAWLWLCSLGAGMPHYGNNRCWREYACYVWEGYITAHKAYGTHTMDARQCRPGSEHVHTAARLDGGGVRCTAVAACAMGARLEQY